MKIKTTHFRIFCPPRMPFAFFLPIKPNLKVKLNHCLCLKAFILYSHSSQKWVVLPRWAQSLPSLTIWLTLVSLQLFLPVILPLLGYSLIAQLVKNPPAMQETLVWFLGQEDLLGKGRLPTTVFLGFPCGSAGKESACNAGGQGSIPGLGRSPGEGNSYPLQYSGLENSMDCIVHGVAKSQTWLSDFQAINSLRNKYKF